MDVELSQMIFSASIKVIMIFVFHSINVKSHKLTCICRTILTSLVAQMVKNLPAMWETRVQSLCQENPLEKGMATHSNILREGNGNPLRYSYLKRSMDRGAWWATVHGIVKSQIQLRDFHSLTFDIV